MTTKKWKWASIVPSQRCTSSAEHVTRPVHAATIRQRSGKRLAMASALSMRRGPMSKSMWPIA